MRIATDSDEEGARFATIIEAVAVEAGKRELAVDRVMPSETKDWNEVLLRAGGTALVYSGGRYRSTADAQSADLSGKSGRIAACRVRSGEGCGHERKPLEWTLSSHWGEAPLCSRMPIQHTGEFTNSLWAALCACLRHYHPPTRGRSRGAAARPVGGLLSRGGGGNTGNRRIPMTRRPFRRRDRYFPAARPILPTRFSATYCYEGSL